jgi:hypothetical protein
MTTTTSTLFIAGIAAVLVSNISLASAKPSPSFHEILLPTPNVTGGPAGEIQCYALPFGAVGIISHLLTDWTIAWMIYGKAPLWPGHDMDSYLFDMFLATISLCTCVPIASITIHRCRLSWHFVLICIWKLVTSVSLACVTLHRCLIIRTEEKRKKQTSRRQIDYQMTGFHQYQPVPTAMECILRRVTLLHSSSEMFQAKATKATRIPWLPSGGSSCTLLAPS